MLVVEEMELLLVMEVAGIESAPVAEIVPLLVMAAVRVIVPLDASEPELANDVAETPKLPLELDADVVEPEFAVMTPPERLTLGPELVPDKVRLLPPVASTNVPAVVDTPATVRSAAVEVSAKLVEAEPETGFAY